MTATVRDVMVADVVTVDGMARLMDALDLMLEKNVKSLVVPRRTESDAYGILTFSDIAKEVIAGDSQQLEMLNVFDVMSKPCFSVEPGLDIKYAARMLTRLCVSRMIVIENDRLAGIVSLTDLVKSLRREKI